MKHRKQLTPELRDVRLNQQQRLLTLDEVCVILADSRSSFYRRPHPLLKKRIKIGRSSRWSLQVVEDWIKENAA
jgi:predicted DNA-binding transcriptional regulator AlpA